MAIPFSIYAGLAKTASKTCSAGILWPLVRSSKVEAHLLDFSGKLYGKRNWVFSLNFGRFRFNDEDALKTNLGGCEENTRLPSSGLLSHLCRRYLRSSIYPTSGQEAGTIARERAATASTISDNSFAHERINW